MHEITLYAIDMHKTRLTTIFQIFYNQFENRTSIAHQILQDLRLRPNHLDHPLGDIQCNASALHIQNLVHTWSILSIFYGVANVTQSQ